MNNREFNVIKRKVDKFANRANLYTWHNNVLMSTRHRFSLRESGIEYHSRYLPIPHPEDVFLLTCNNDIVLISSRYPQEIEEWQIEPNDAYTWVTGEDGLFQLEWEVIAQVPTSLLNSILTIFKEYFDVKIDYPVLTFAIPHRIPHQIYKGGVIYLPNSTLVGVEYEWVLAMQRACIDGREIPPRPEIFLGMKLQREGLYDGIEWDGEGAE